MHNTTRFSAPVEVAPDTLHTLVEPYTILIADDHPVVREGLVALIGRRTEMRVIAEAGNGREAVDRFLAFMPDIALFDLRMPLMDGVEAMLAVFKTVPMARIVIVSSYQTQEDVYRALRGGARGYILKDAPAKDLLECIQSVMEDQTWIPPPVGSKLAKRVADRGLTTREMEVIREVVRGRSNKEIASRLNISESTVKVHMTHILDKLQVTSRTEAIASVLNRGLINMDSTATGDVSDTSRPRVRSEPYFDQRHAKK
ncbi:MAG TPA: response regulator transcription factor [Acidobacteriaceae bacterium]